MEYVISSPQQKKDFFDFVRRRIEENTMPPIIKYICLNNVTVRVQCYTEKILLLLKQQFTYVLRDNADKYNATIVVWEEPEPRYFLAPFSSQFDPRKNIQLRLDNVLFHKFYVRIRENINGNSAFMEIDDDTGNINAYDAQENTYYIGSKSLIDDDIIKIKWCHLFVLQLYRICNTPTTHLVHGAVIGLNGKGVLLCARGGGGKSTLSVNALLDNFEFVSEDFLVLQKEKDVLYASPIYSVINLSPKMYAAMYERFASKFISNNTRLDKYVFNIAAYHQQFRDKYPLKLCMSLSICPNIKEPEIIIGNIGPAITRLIHSTISQNEDIYNTTAVKKMVDFIKPLPCYHINLCPDIEKNTQCLRNFLTSYKGE